MTDPVYIKDLEDRLRHTKAALEKATEQLKLHSGDTASLSSELRNLREQYDELHDQRHAEARKADVAMAALEAMRKERDDYKLDADTRLGTIKGMNARLRELEIADDDLDEAETERDTARADAEKYKSELERHVRMLSECVKERDTHEAQYKGALAVLSAVKDRLQLIEYDLHRSQDCAVGAEHVANEKLHAVELQLHSANEAMTGLRAEITDLKKALSKEKQDREVAEREITELRTGAPGPNLKAAMDLMDKLAYGKWEDMCEIARYSVMGQVVEAAVGPWPAQVAPSGSLLKQWLRVGVSDDCQYCGADITKGDHKDSCVVATLVKRTEEHLKGSPS